LAVLVLVAEGDYSETAAGQALPGFPVEPTAEFIRQRTFTDEIKFIDEFRVWCQSRKQR
jgi:hypothetical protein